ncbi:hypothetical protein CWO07_23450 [Vibrio splendidus]|uniref:Uncharacterized protein n=1 Tax=Vibrio splendidus TaxID=29497 RepID=A0A2T5EMC2_VIBSP|nr:hypothetical protein [Vibrio splendidus]OEF65784.1 hypothetical protein A148_06550 [Vibrio splendidus 1F-157]PTP22031.1 hypothetical protein CWO07_23450 [Vibrio splendidus]PTP67675.1 hypothetical protein CWO23_16480 [Vibrio splendidus]RIH71238.1 hypothetical protein BJG01_16965 [Vibrio splendidus]
MGGKRLSNSFAISTLFVCMSIPALELDKSQPMLALIEQGCAYGRGSMAIESAKADGLNNLRLFLQGKASGSFTTEEHALVEDQFDQHVRELLIASINANDINADFSAPKIQGDDTCITVRLAPELNTGTSFVNTGDGIEWDDAPVMSVVVVGEGRESSILALSAREVAEQDAFKRAISQVFGAMVNSGYMQKSYGTLSGTESSNDFDLQEIAMQSLSLEPQGMISSWNEISYQEKPNGSVTVTLDVFVERQKMEAKIARLIKSLSQPSIYVDAGLPVVKNTFSNALAEMGFDLASNPAQSSVILDVQENQKVTSFGLQLELSATVVDRAGNRYGSWHNDPTFMTLPNKVGMLNELAAVHLAVEGNQIALKRELQSSVQTMASRGGPIRELIFSQEAAGKQGKLYRLIGDMNGVSDIKSSQQGGNIVIQLRSLSDASDLVQDIEPMLRNHQPNYRSKVDVLNEYQIRVL